MAIGFTTALTTPKMIATSTMVSSRVELPASSPAGPVDHKRATQSATALTRP